MISLNKQQQKIKRFMTWHVVDSQSTHVEPIYPMSMVTFEVEVPKAPDWAA
jgi:hypothetical protein